MSASILSPPSRPSPPGGGAGLPPAPGAINLPREQHDHHEQHDEQERDLHGHDQVAGHAADSSGSRQPRFIRLRRIAGFPRFWPTATL